MPIVVPVKFPFAARELWFDPQGLDIVEADYAVCSTERGTELGLVTADPFEVDESELAAPLKPVLRIATDADLDRADELADRGDAAMTDFRRLVKQNGLDMKPVGVEFLFGGEKAVFYFAAEDRVDFRQLVKDLSACFHTRVDMRQIGVRDETRLAGGYATCGQELCCTRFGGQFEPVSIRMAKEQDLPLNSAKISGVCGRLMCCLRYEFEAYKDFKSRAPKKKTLIDTPLGKAKIQEYDTPREQLVLRLEGGKTFRVNLSDMTCSDACKKKAEEQHCACRPDCVTRGVLEKIDSADISLALMELDRQNGMDVGDGLSQADRIVTSGPTRRRRAAEGGPSAQTGGSKRTRGKSRSAQAEPARDEAAGAAGEGSSTGRRRRKRSTGTAAEGQERTSARRPGDGAAQQATGDASAGSGSTRRRRRHLTAEERNDAFRSAAAREGAGTGAPGAGNSDAAAADAKGSASAAPGRSRRRRHTAGSSAEGFGGRGRSVKPDTPSVADQLSEGEVKVTRRRPGDGGGARGGSSSGAAEERGANPAASGEKGEGQAPKRRRRRRPRKPRSEGGEGSAPAAPSGDA